MANVNAPEAIGQGATEPCAEDACETNDKAQIQPRLSGRKAVIALEQDRRPDDLAIGEERGQRRGRCEQ